MKTKVLGNRVLLERIPQKTTTDSGIFLHQKPDWLDDRKQWRVIAVGTGKDVYCRRTKTKHHVPIEVAPGDRVLVDPNIGSSITLDDGRMLVDADLIEMKW